MKKLIIVLIVLINISTTKASDSLNNNKRFFIGVSVCPFSNFYYSKTDSLIVLTYEKRKLIPFSTTFFKPFGLTFEFRISNTIYFHTAGIYEEQFIKELGDQENSGKGGNIKDYFSYKAKYIQVPVSFSFKPYQDNSIYFNVGIKNNFIFYEHLYGDINNVSLGPNGYSTSSSQHIDIADKNFKFTSIVPSIDLGYIWINNNRFWFKYYFSFDFLPIYKKDNKINDFSFYQISIANFQLVYKL